MKKIRPVPGISPIAQRMLFVLVFSAPLSLFAHPGHGETEGFSIIHYFSEPVHALVAGLGAMAVIALAIRVRRAGKKQDTASR